MHLVHTNGSAVGVWDPMQVGLVLLAKILPVIALSVEPHGRDELAPSWGWW